MRRDTGWPTLPLAILAAFMIRLAQVLGTIFSNAIPLIGVFWLKWDVFEVLLLYWFENVAIGLAHAVRLGIASVTNKAHGGLAATLFFLLHYGFFALGHGLFVLLYFGLSRDGLSGFQGGFALPVLSIFAWQAAYLALDIRDSGGFKGRNPAMMMFEPYPRVFALHVAVVGGGFLIGQMGSPVWAVAGLVLAKMVSDLVIGLVLAPGRGAEQPPSR